MSEKRKQEARGSDDEPESSVAKKSKTEEEEEEQEEEQQQQIEEGDSDGDSDDEAAYSGELPSSEEDEDEDDDDNDDVDEEELYEDAGGFIQGLEVELKKMDDGNYLLLEKDDAPKELKLVIPSTVLAEISKRFKEKSAKGSIPVLDAKDIEVVTNIEEELVCHAEILEIGESLDKSDKEIEQALNEEWAVVRIEGHSETFGTVYFADEQ